MLNAKEIIVVAPDHYKDLARKLTHEISKLPGCNGAFWSIKQYEDNEFQLGGNRYVLLMGNSNENRITKDFLPVLSTYLNQAGACYGYDGSKALVFGEGKLEQAEAFKEVLKKSAAYATTAGAGAGAGVGVGVGLAGILYPIAPLWLLIYMVGRWRRSAKEKKLRQEQTKAALTLFLAECFDKWVGIGKTEQGK